jgi:hypothetical protein
MQSGTSIAREWIIVLDDGRAVLDWGTGVGVDLLSGDNVPCEGAIYSHPITDEELDMLRRAGRVTGYDARMVSVLGLPEPPHSEL